MTRDGCKSAVAKMTLEVVSAVGKAIIYIMGQGTGNN